MHTMVDFFQIIFGLNLNELLMTWGKSNQSRLIYSIAFIAFIHIFYGNSFARADMIPRWSGLNHFSAIMKQEFTDGSKYEDIAKVLFIFTSCYVFLY